MRVNCPKGKGKGDSYKGKGKGMNMLEGATDLGGGAPSAAGAAAPAPAAAPEAAQGGGDWESPDFPWNGAPASASSSPGASPQ